MRFLILTILLIAATPVLIKKAFKNFFIWSMRFIDLDHETNGILERIAAAPIDPLPEPGVTKINLIATGLILIMVAFNNI